MPDEKLEWWAGSSEERYEVGPCATAEEAAAELFADDPDLKEVNLGVGIECPFQIDNHDMESFLENIGENLYDNLYEDALDGWCDKIKSAAWSELADQVEPIVVAWLKKHGQATSWTLIEHRETRARSN